MKKWKHFKKEEFACPCCGFNNISESFIDKLDVAREYARIPFKINSACRCPMHNSKVGGKRDSSHVSTKATPCKAADIDTDSGSERFTIVSALIRAGFRRIGIAKGFIHADDDMTKPQDVIWTYD